jgi:hypothetical protein
MSENRTQNVLMPTTEVQGRLTPFHIIRSSEVMVQPSETYEIVEYVDGRKIVHYGLGKPALNRIAQAAGIEFIVDKTGLVGTPTREYLQYRAVARMRLQDGTFIERPGTVEWFYDLEVQPILDEVEELKREYEERRAKGEPLNSQDMKRLAGKLYGKKKQAHDALAKRVPMVETKAMLRAIRALLPIKSKYTAEELRAPFVVPRVDVVPDVDNPNVQALMQSRAIDISRALYGTSSEAAAPALAAAPDELLPEYEPYRQEPAVDDFEEVPFTDDAGDDMAWDAELVDEPGEEQIDPGDYRIEDTGSKFTGMTLHEVESARPGYCKEVLKRGWGSPEMRSACLAYLESYQPDNFDEVVNGE